MCRHRDAMSGMHKALIELELDEGFAIRCRQRPTLPRPLGRSTIGAVGLNDRVRDGNGCGPYALIAGEIFCSADADEAKRRGRGRRGRIARAMRTHILRALRLRIIPA